MEVVRFHTQKWNFFFQKNFRFRYNLPETRPQYPSEVVSMKRNRLQKFGDFMLGKGFYIVLFLCVAVIGISGYYLIQSLTGTGETAEPVTANPSITLPDSSAESPVLPQPVEQEPEEPPAETAQEDDPQPLKEPADEAAAAPEEPVNVVYTWPVKGQVLRSFSVETLAYDATMGDWRTHSGVDIAAEAGIKVLSAGEGQVVEVYADALMGTTVVVQQPDGVTAVYSNLAEETAVNPGDEVETGAVLGTVGGTAIAESGMESHLHLEMMVNEDYVDPLTYLPAQS